MYSVTGYAAPGDWLRVFRQVKRHSIMDGLHA
jgi:hypothetical protein